MIYRGLPGSNRRLLYLPIVHTPADMGTLGSSINRAKVSAFGQRRVERAAADVQKLWDRIETIVTNLADTPGIKRVYQDGLPVCGREPEIVAELAEAGSRNYGLLLKLQAQGAVLMGTESPELLVEEYQVALAKFAPGGAAAAGKHRDRLRHDLIDRRDRYVAERINRTLLSGETGMLFMGMMHKIARWLDPGISVVYPLGSGSGKQEVTKSE